MKVSQLLNESKSLELVNMFSLLSNEEKASFLKSLNFKIDHQEVISYLNDNDIDYYNLNDLALYAKYYAALACVKENATSMTASYNDGDVVKLHTHTKGTDTGSYGKFNILRVTPTQLHITDHKDGNKVLKFNKQTLRGIGDADHLLVKEDHAKLK